MLYAPETTTSQRPLFMALFSVAIVVAFIAAALPHPPALPGAPNDKVQHILAFAVLTVLALAAWPRRPWWRIVLGLSAFGALIELVQLIPPLNRDGNWTDWAVDTMTVLTITALAMLIRRSGELAAPARSSKDIGLRLFLALGTISHRFCSRILLG